MSYINRHDIEAIIPPPHLLAALDDDRDGQEDPGLLDTVLESASRQVDSYLEAIRTTPLDPVPAFAREAARIFAAEAIYDRRQILDKNPFADRARAWRERLADIASGKVPFSAAEGSRITAITEPVRINTSML
jgi:phage gp36-like protein